MLCENHYLISAIFPRLGNFCALTREIFFPSKGTKNGHGSMDGKILTSAVAKAGCTHICDRCDSSKTGVHTLKYFYVYINIYIGINAT